MQLLRKIGKRCKLPFLNQNNKLQADPANQWVRSSGLFRHHNPKKGRFHRGTGVFSFQQADDQDSNSSARAGLVTLRALAYPFSNQVRVSPIISVWRPRQHNSHWEKSRCRQRIFCSRRDLLPFCPGQTACRLRSVYRHWACPDISSKYA